MSAITGALNYINPTQGIVPAAKGVKNELEEIEKKIALHEKLIDGRIQQIKICKEIDDIKQEINKYIDKQYKNKHKKKLINREDTIDKNERDKLEMEYNNLINEINGIETEYEKIKKENEKRNKIDIELENIINKIKYYSNNIFQNKENI